MALTSSFDKEVVKGTEQCMSSFIFMLNNLRAAISFSLIAEIIRIISSPSQLSISIKVLCTTTICAPVSTTSFKVLHPHLMITNLRSSIEFLTVSLVDFEIDTLAVTNSLIGSCLLFVAVTKLFAAF